MRPDKLADCFDRRGTRPLTAGVRHHIAIAVRPSSVPSGGRTATRGIFSQPMCACRGRARTTAGSPAATSGSTGVVAAFDIRKDSTDDHDVSRLRRLGPQVGGRRWPRREKRVVLASGARFGCALPCLAGLGSPMREESHE